MINSNVKLLKEVVSFLRHPCTSYEDEKGNVYRDIIVLISWLYVLVFPLAILISVLLKLLNYNGINAVNAFAASGDLWTVLFFGAIAAPLIEETTFRLSLKFRPFYIAVSIFFVTRIITVYVMKQFFSSNNINMYSWMIPVVAGGLVYFIMRSNDIKERVSRFYQKYFSLLFYFFTLLFGLVHITNYSKVENILLIVLLLGIPQFIVGLVLGFVRIKHGFWYGVLLHSVYNALLLVPGTIAKEGSSTPAYVVAGVFAFVVFSIFIYGLISLPTSAYKVIYKKY